MILVSTNPLSRSLCLPYGNLFDRPNSPTDYSLAISMLHPFVMPWISSLALTMDFSDSRAGRYCLALSRGSLLGPILLLPLKILALSRGGRLVLTFIMEQVFFGHRV